MLLIDVDDLRVDFLTLGQNVLRLADAAIRDLGNVDEAVNARNDLSECADWLVNSVQGLFASVL